MLPWPTRALAALGFVLLLSGLSACNSSGAAAGPSGRLRVVAAENFWGSIARQLGGNRVSVTSIINNPATDPHSYEPTAGDARTLATAQMAIVNGVGYDSWASQLLAASPAGGRVVLNVGDLLGIPAGGNPHRWYFPADVRRVIARITDDYQRLAPADAAYFAARERGFERVGLRGYDRLIAQIRLRYHGVPVGYSESIFQGMGEALGLRLATPYPFAKAIAEGSEPTPREIATIDGQITHHLIDVWVFNSQNATPDVARLTSLARANGIPIATITETLAPAGDSFQRWQVAQLRRLQAALARGVAKR